MAARDFYWLFRRLRWLPEPAYYWLLDRLTDNDGWRPLFYRGRSERPSGRF